MPSFVHFFMLYVWRARIHVGCFFCWRTLDVSAMRTEFKFIPIYFHTAQAALAHICSIAPYLSRILLPSNSTSTLFYIIALKLFCKVFVSFHIILDTCYSRGLELSQEYMNLLLSCPNNHTDKVEPLDQNTGSPKTPYLV